MAKNPLGRKQTHSRSMQLNYAIKENEDETVKRRKERKKEKKKTKEAMLLNSIDI